MAARCLRIVDRLAGKQRGATRLELARLGQRNQKIDGLARHLVLGEIQKEIVQRHAEILKTQRIGREKIERPRIFERQARGNRAREKRRRRRGTLSISIRV